MKARFIAILLVLCIVVNFIFPLDKYNEDYELTAATDMVYEPSGDDMTTVIEIVAVVVVVAILVYFVDSCTTT